MIKRVPPIPAKPLFAPSASLQKSFLRRFKFIRTLDADNRSLLRRLISKIKILFNLQGEAHGFIKSPVFPDCTQMRFLLTQGRFLKTFVSNLGCGIKYIIEERKLGRHFRNLASEYFNILEPETWNSIGRKQNFKRVKINVSGLNEFIPLKLKIEEGLFNQFARRRAHRLFSSLQRAKNLKMIDVSYSEMDDIFKWAYKKIDAMIPLLGRQTAIEFNLLSGSERHALVGIGLYGNPITFQLPYKKVPIFNELTDLNTGKYYRLNFQTDDEIAQNFSLDFKKVTNGRYLLEKLQESESKYFIPETITTLFLKVRAICHNEIEMIPENKEITIGDVIYKLQVLAPLKKFLSLDLLTSLKELEIEFETFAITDNTYLDILRQVKSLEYLSVMIKLRQINLLDFANLIKHLLDNGLKGLELKFDVSLKGLIDKCGLFYSIKMLRIVGEISPIENLEALLQSLNADKLWLEGIHISNGSMKKVFQDIGKSLRGNDVKLKVIAKTELNSKEEFWESVKDMLVKMKGVKVLSIILEARIVLVKDDAKKIYDALTNSRCCLEKLLFRVSRGSYVEFTLVNGVYKISSHGFKPPMVKMWIIEPNGNWTEVFNQRDTSQDDFKRLGIPMI